MVPISQIIADLKTAASENKLNHDLIKNMVDKIVKSTENVHTRRTKRTALRNVMRELKCPEEWFQCTYNKEEYLEATRLSNAARNIKLMNVRTFDYSLFFDLVWQNFNSPIKSRLYIVIQLATGCRFKTTCNPDHIRINKESGNIVVFSSKQNKWIERPLLFLTFADLEDLLGRLKKMDHTKSVSSGVNRLLAEHKLRSHDLRRVYSEICIALYKPPNYDNDIYRQILFAHENFTTTKCYAYIRVTNVPSFD